MRFRRNWLSGCAWWLLAAVTVHAQPRVTLTAEIAPQSLALAAFASQTGLQVAYVSDVVGSRRSKGVPPGLSIAVAYTRMVGLSTAWRF